MVSNWAMIQDSVVDNVCLWDGDTNTWQPPEGYLMEPLPDPNTNSVGIGWGWDGTNFVAPVLSEPVPDPALDNPGSPPDVIQ
jgi:hypothetical protein